MGFVLVMLNFFFRTPRFNFVCKDPMRSARDAYGIGRQISPITSSSRSDAVVLAELLSLPGAADLPPLLLSIIALPSIGPLVAVLRSDKATIMGLEEQVRSHDERAHQVSRRATEYMRVVYEMAEVLSASRLDPRRVLSSAVDMVLHALERVGIVPPLYGAIMLFAETTDGVMLRMARSKSSTRLPRMSSAWRPKA